MKALLRRNFQHVSWCKLDAECRAQPRVACWRDGDGAMVPRPCQPPELEATRQYSATDVPGDMIPALAPIQARPAVNAPRSRLRSQSDAKALEKAMPFVRHLAAIVAEREVVRIDQGIGNRD